MASVTQKIPNYVAGISEQPDELKFPGQVRDLLNCVPDVTKQLVKRPGSRFVTEVTDGLSNEWFSYYRDEQEQYVGCVRTGGEIDIFDVLNGTEEVVNQASTEYFEHTDADAIQLLTVNDFTFATNREIRPRMLAEGADGTTQSVKVVAGRYTGSATGGNNIGTTAITGSGTGMTVDVTTNAGNNTITQLTINTAGSNYTNGDLFSINGYPNTAGVYLDDAKSAPEIPEGYVEVKILAYGREYAFDVRNSNGTTISSPSVSTTADPTQQITVNNILTGWQNDLRDDGFTTTIIGNGIYFSKDEDFSIDIIDTQTINGFTDNVNTFDRLPFQCKTGMLVKVANADSSDEDDFYVVFKGDRGNNGVGIWEETVAPNLYVKFDPAFMPHQIVRNAQGNFTVGQVTWEPMVAGNYDTNPLPSFINSDDPTTAGEPINKILLFRNRLVYLSQENVNTSQAGAFFDLLSTSVISLSPADPIQIAASSNKPAILYDGVEINNGLVLFGETQQYLLSSEDSAVGLTQETVKLNSIANYLYDRQVKPAMMGTTVGFTNMGGTSFRLFEMSNIDLQGQPNANELSKVVSLLLPDNLISLADSMEGNLIMFASDDPGRTNEVWGFRYYTVGEERKQNAWFRWELPGQVLYHTIMRDTYFAVCRIDGENKVLAFDIKETDNTALNEDDYRVHMDCRLDINPDTANATFDTEDRETTFDIPSNIENFRSLNVLRNTTVIDVTNGSDIPTTSVKGIGTGLTVTLTITNSRQINTIEIEDEGINYFNGDTFTIDGYPGLLVQYLNGQVYAYNLIDGNYKPVTINTDNPQWVATVDGDWTQNDFYVGYLFDMRVSIPRFYVTNQSAGANVAVKADTRASLVIHRFNVEAGATGVFDVTLYRPGYDDYTETYYPAIADAYKANYPMIVPSLTRTISCYMRNKQMEVELHSRHPSPFTLFSISWEGDFSNKYYRSV